MNLFSIRGTDGKTVKDAGFFATKAEAKVARDELNKGKPAELAKDKKKPQFFVAVGPDHFRYER